jgi:NHL repeat-containing protein
LILRSEIEYTSKFIISGTLSLFAITLIVSLFILFIPNVPTANALYVFQRMWGTVGSGNGLFDEPTGVAVDSSRNVFVVDSGNHRIQKFRISSTCPIGTTQVVSGVRFVTKWGTQGTGPGQFKWPNGICLDSSENVYVADTFNHRIQKFTNTGSFLTAWDTHGTGGIGPAQFGFPVDLDVINSGIVFFEEYVYIADLKNNRIQVFTWKPEVQPTTNLNLKASLQNNNNTAITRK